MPADSQMSIVKRPPIMYNEPRYTSIRRFASKYNYLKYEKLQISFIIKV